MANHLLSRAARLFFGEVWYPRYNGTPANGSQTGHLNGGAEVTMCYLHPFGAPAAIDTNALIAAATSTELPNTATTTYTTATSGTSPLDDAGLPTVASLQMANGATQSVWVLDVPRAITATMTHASAVVASSLVVSGYDQYGEAMSELFTFTAGTTSKSVAGKKAFKWILSYAITAAGDATANTLNVGWNDVLGLPFRFTDKNDVLPMGNGAPDASATVVIADDTTATTSTGDVRGTIDFNTASDGTKLFKALMMKVDRSGPDHFLCFGVAQA